MLCPGIGALTLLVQPLSFAKGESDEGLDLAQPIVVEGEVRVIRHKPSGPFRGFVELRVTGARRVW